MSGIFAGRRVLVTGGTQGIGLATALGFARHGAEVTVTYAWGSEEPEAVAARFARHEVAPPRMLRADVGRSEDTTALLAALAAEVDGIDVLISNASLANQPRSLDDYDERALSQSIRYGAWPLVAYARGLHATFGRWPRHIVAMSSDGPDRFSLGYDYVAASKAVLETLVRYLSWHLRHEDVRVNAIRSRAVRTASFEATFGPALSETARRFASERYFVEADEVAGAALALAGGLLDAVKGQVLVIDRGTAFRDNLLRVYEERERLPL